MLCCLVFVFVCLFHVNFSATIGIYLLEHRVRIFNFRFSLVLFATFTPINQSCRILTPKPNVSRRCVAECDDLQFRDIHLVFALRNALIIGRSFFFVQFLFEVWLLINDISSIKWLLEIISRLQLILIFYARTNVFFFFCKHIIHTHVMSDLNLSYFYCQGLFLTCYLFCLE